MDVGWGGGNYEQPTVLSNSTGNGPYTTSFTGSTTKTHAQGDPISHVEESYRQQHNQYIGNGPVNIGQVIDFDSTVERDDPGSGQYIYYLGQPVHLSQDGYARMAEAVRVQLT